MGYQSLIWLITILLPIAVFAQSSDVVDAADEEGTTQIQTTVEEPAEASQRNVEKIEVTGSYIRRSDVEGPSPVITIDRAQIEASGFNEVGQLLRADTSSSFGGNGNNVSLRGLGYSRTLVLINGQRAPRNGSSYGAQGSSVNLVPLAAVERIEILKDGASATYGSEAIGGVVNIITRKNIDGVIFTTKYDLSETNGGDTSRTSMAYAKNTSKDSVLASVQYTHRQGVRISDFDYRKGSLDRTSYAPNIATSKAGFKAAPNCPNGQVNRAGACVVDLAPLAGSLAENDWGGVFSYSREFSGDTELYTTLVGNYTQNNSFNPGSAFAVPGGTTGFKFRGAEAQKLAQNSFMSKLGSGDYSANDAINIYGSLPNSRVTKEEEYTAGLIVGTKGYWGNSDWGWDVSMNNQVFEGYARRQGIGLFNQTTEAMLNGSYDPFSTATQSTEGLTTDAVSRDRYQVNWLSAISNGSLGNFAGATWSTAIGVSAAHFEYREDSDDRAVATEFIGLVGADAGGERQLYSGFTELSGMFGNKFESQLALRFDQYSDFGNTLNPKLAFRYQPVRSLTLRTSAGTGFNAPSLQQAYGPNLEFFLNNLNDPRGCALSGDPNSTNCDPISVSGQRATNADLKQETSLNFNFGAVWEPVKRLNFGIDYWRVKVDNVVFGGDAQTLLELEAQGVDVSKYNASIIRDPNTNQAERITLGLSNAGTREVDGIDASAGYLFKTRSGDISVNTVHSYLFHYTESFYDELGKEEVLGQGGLPRWRNVTSLGYKLGWFGSQIVARTTSRMEKSARRVGNIEQFTQFDVNFDFTLGRTSRMSVGAINAFDQRPALDEFDAGLINTNLYRPIRVTYLSYRQDF